MAQVKWVKIVTDIFDDEKILLIENMPESDSIIVIWFKLLCLAGKQNNKGVFLLTDKIAYTEEMLATIFRRKESTVKLAMKVFASFGMIEVIEDVITIPNWDKHQSIEKLDKIQEQNRERQKRFRTNQKELAEKSNVTLTLSNATEEEEEEDKKKIRYNIIEFLNSTLGTNYKSNSKKNITLINARLNEGYSFEDFKIVIQKKTVQWQNTEMEQYLRPETLFGPKFEGYLNEKVTLNKQQKQLQGNIETEDFFSNYGKEEDYDKTGDSTIIEVEYGDV